jgi:dTDP-glucose 4,6-dehydratase
MRILVTGGAGFIGSNFVRRTLSQRPGVQIVVLDALTYAGRLSNLDDHLDRIEFVHGNITDRELVDNLINGVDAIVHFAAESHNDNSLASPDPFVETNIIGTFTLIKSAAKWGKRFHHVSTDEVFGDIPLQSKYRFNESTPYNPSSPYSASKASSDHLVRAWGRSFGLNATISICSNNFGPFQHEEKLIPRTILLASSDIKPKIYGTGSNVRDWIHVDDHNDGIWAILDKGMPGHTYLLGANNQRTNLQVVKSILNELGKAEDFIEFVDDRPGHDLKYAIDPSKAISELEWSPTLDSFESQLSSVVNFYLSVQIDLDRISNSGLSVTSTDTSENLQPRASNV